MQNKSAGVGHVPKYKNRLRLWVQVCFTAITNGYAIGFAKGTIYTGHAKMICVPGLNCYSCPGAFGACPIGALQAVLGSNSYRISFYVIGTLMLFGMLLGRFVCGWLCPFGLVQDLIYRIPFVKKIKNLPGHRGLVWIKFLILAGFVIILPLTVVDFVGQGKPWFCEYICPSGTLMAGLPLVGSNSGLQSTVGGLFFWKVAVLVVLLLLSIMVYRPFCKYLCPLGAIYGLMNPVALYSFKVEDDLCVNCGACQNACKMDIKVWQNPNSMECIRCGDCIKACPTGALHRRGMGLKCSGKPAVKGCGTKQTEGMTGE